LFKAVNTIVKSPFSPNLAHVNLSCD